MHVTMANFFLETTVLVQPVTKYTCYSRADILYLTPAGSMFRCISYHHLEFVDNLAQSRHTTAATTQHTDITITIGLFHTSAQWRRAKRHLKTDFRKT